MDSQLIEAVSGGCTIKLVLEDGVENFISKILAAYVKKFIPH